MDEDERVPLIDSDADYAEDEARPQRWMDEDDGGYDDEDQSEETEEEEDSRSEGGSETARPAPLNQFGPVFTPEMVEAYADQMGMTTEQVGVAAHLVEQILQHHSAVDAVTNSVISREAEMAPQFFAEYGSRIKAHLSRIPAEQRGNRKMVQVASVLAYLEAAPETDDLTTIIGGLARRLGAKRSYRERETEPEPERERERPRIPPERRTPQPAAAGRAAPPAPSRQRSGGDEVTRGFMSRFGLDPIHAREIDYALKTRTGWR